MALKNPYPEQHDTHERQQGGNTSVSGEKHGQKKATTIPEDKRFSREVVTPVKRRSDGE